MKWLTLVVLLLSGAVQLFACNHCGGSTSGTALGLLPISARNYAGTMLLFSRQSLYDGNSLLSESSSLQTSTFGSYSLNEKWSVQIMMPVSYNVLQSVNYETTSNSSGVFLGDLQLLGRYVMKFGMTEETKVANSLSLSVGLELPTGTFNANYKVEGLPASFYPGSKSFDPIAGFQYQFSKGNYSLMGNAQFKYSTYNKDHFKAGVQWSAAALASRKFGAWSPFLGLGFDTKENDWKYTFEQEGSEYDLTYALAGLEWSGRNVLIGSRNHINLYSEFGETKAKNAGMLSVYMSYFF